MATFFVDSTGVVTTASTDSDSIFIQSAAVRGSELLGLAGNDTINITQGAAADGSAVGMIARGADGDDLFIIDDLGSFSAGDHTLIGGAGNDTVNISGSTADWLKGNSGADRVVISGESTFSAIALGSGADELVLQSTTATRIALGDGHDKVSASTLTFATAGSLIGGAGRDTIDLTIATNSIATAFINGGAAQDSITIDGLEAGTTVKGMGGADTITISGDVDGGSAFIAAGADNDLITISGLTTESTVAGGAGNDTIVLADNIENASAEIFGGSGADSIHFDAIAEDDTYLLVDVAGGQGADSITFSSNGTIGSGEVLGTLVYSSFSESNLSDGLDTFELNGTIVSGVNAGTKLDLQIDFTDNLTAITVGEVSASVLLNDANFSGNITTNLVTLSGSTYNVSSVTAVAGTVDTLTLNGGKGATVLFSNNEGEDYVFVQGGTAGVADDSIISLGNLSGGAMATLGNTAMTVTFSGQA
jgi:hypothetical protein